MDKENLVKIIPAEYAEKLTQVKIVQEELKIMEKSFKDSLKNEMEHYNIKDIEVDNITFSYIRAYEKNDFDTKKFAAEHPKMFKEYSVKKAVASSLRTTAKI